LHTYQELTECNEIKFLVHPFLSLVLSFVYLPVYLYGYAAREDYRRTVPEIRGGQYENLPEKVEFSKLQKCRKIDVVHAAAIKKMLTILPCMSNMSEI
jgi:glutamate formiminotransferase